MAKKIKKCLTGTDTEQDNTNTKKTYSPYVTDAQGTDFLKNWYNNATTQKMLSEINTNMKNKFEKEKENTSYTYEEKVNKDINERIQQGLSVPQYKAVYKEYPNGTTISLPLNVVRSINKGSKLNGIDHNRIKSGSSPEERNNIYTQEVTKAYNNSNTMGSYDRNTKSVVYNPKYFNPSLQTHEVDHSVQNEVPETLETTQPVEYKLKPGVQKDSYLDRTNEIRSRIMELRYKNNLNPDKRDYTPEEAQQMINNMEDGQLKQDLDRLDSGTLADYLNYMASNNKYKRNDNLAKLGKNKSIYIKPSKRGSFTSAANDRGLGVQEFANKVLNNKDNYSTSMVKKANFARNAAKWNKKLMGYSSTGELKKAKLGKDKQDDKISYLEVNPNIIGDSIIAGANIGNSIASYFRNKKSLNELNSPKEPIYLNRVKHKTRVNINPQLSVINKEANENLQSIKDNTKSSKVALDRMRKVQLNKADRLIDIYGKKENAETELINKDIESNAATDRYNNALTNYYINRKSDFDNKLIEAKGENTQALIQNLASSVSNFMNSINKNNSELRNINALAAGYENVSPELLKEKGISYPMWLKQRRNKRNNKR